MQGASVAGREPNFHALAVGKEKGLTESHDGEEDAADHIDEPGQGARTVEGAWGTAETKDGS